MAKISTTWGVELMSKFIASGLLFSLGCSIQAVNTAEVSGTVTIDGQPVDGVEVNFVGEKFAGFGKTDSVGHYKLIHGAALGKNKVSFSKMVGNTDFKIDPEAGMDEEQYRLIAESSGGKIGNLPKQLIPAEYRDASTTKLTYEVLESGTTNADFKLSSK